MWREGKDDRGKEGKGREGGKEWGRTEGTIPVTEDRLHNEHREVIWRAPADTLDSDSNMCGRHSIITYSHLGTSEGSLVL